ncbi:MAG: molybdopterin-dependent oxidoreductase [SAR202 cluster bacterium]|jgi:CO/xanthine dehydrogenase Mo-binding subunit/aerobic-type carbon monoxide dehydrogenase small subunit (CoxS/CutS family)|nr:molybdopterin-dependent oxidoreductase [SAR202 cluster bacterium]MDP6714548.1 molybdopterin-dependent oxidoreductase [SAR202 cluster bacterium]
MQKQTTDVQVTLKVNGADHSLDVNSEHTLLEVLRDDLGLTGTKRGCEDGTCGTCTVKMGGAMARACRVSLQRATGRDITTIESLGTADELHPLQEAFIEADAVQCGFCTPGMLMAAKSLLDRNPHPSRDQIVRALGSNLCRCTGYASIIDAVDRAANANGNGLPPAKPTPWEPRWRTDATDKALGRAEYAADLMMPEMLHAAVLRSPHAHAELVSVDTSRAEALPGVQTVVTAKDVPGLNRFGRSLKDQPVLADDKVRQIGDAVAAVAADSPEIAAQALSLISVDYRVLPSILNPADGLKPDAPQIHEKGNILVENDYSWGDAGAGLDEADFVIDHTYNTPWCEQAYLEPEAALAYMDDDQVVIKTATQHSFLHKETVAETMNLPEDKVRVVPTVIGGAFGGKTDVSCQSIVALLTLKTNRPVKIVYTRAESFATTPKRHPFQIRCRTGVTKDGKLTSLDAEMLVDTGAYASAGPGLFMRAGVSITGPYYFPNASIRGKSVYTNNTLAGAMRGFGAPQVAFAIESQMDLMAAKLGIDPLEFRMMNRRGAMSKNVTPRDTEQETAYEKTLDAIRPYYENAMRQRHAQHSTDGRWRRGVGLASMRYGIGSSGQTSAAGRAVLELEPSGNVKIFTGVIDMGQGTETAIKLIVAEELGIPFESVSIVTGDTDITPDAGPATGSRVIYSVGNAARNAAIDLREATLDTASELLERRGEDLDWQDGHIVATDDVTVSVALGEVARARVSASLPIRFEGEFIPEPLEIDARTGSDSPYAVYVSGTHMAEVEVDTERGAVRVLRVVAAHDVGRAIFPQGLKGQIDGAVSMGIGLALKEQFIPGESQGFKDYRIPTTHESTEVEMLLVELDDPSADLGAKGVAECATVAVAPAIANAIADAMGDRVFDLPATPDRVLGLGK